MAKRTFTRRFREQFVDVWFRSRGECTFIDHCTRFGISRANGYEWIKRFQAGGVHALEPRSSAPGHCPHETDRETVSVIIAARHAHPTWGPKKLRAWLLEQQPWDIELPAPSTMGEVLKRAGLIATRTRRRRRQYRVSPFVEVKAPNDVWTTDFKGHFRLRDDRYCYPLTLCDCFSRYLLRCDAYLSTNGGCRRSFEQAFIEYGMPQSIRSDNGAPFSAAHSLAGLSQLSVWWIRLGITPELITPASPWENGRHERMHRTLKDEATDPPQSNRRQQQRAFDAFRSEFNEERPHEALGLQTPSTNYTKSARSYPSKLIELEYPTGYQLRRVSDAGTISWAGRRVFLTSVLAGQVVGLHVLDDKRAKLVFGSVVLGAIDNSNEKLHVEALDDEP